MTTPKPYTPDELRQFTEPDLARLHALVVAERHRRAHEPPTLILPDADDDAASQHGATTGQH